MNCACNRYKTCTECRTAYKETVKRERHIKDALVELERLYQIALNNGNINSYVAYDRAIQVINGTWIK